MKINISVPFREFANYIISLISEFLIHSMILIYLVSDVNGFFSAHFFLFSVFWTKSRKLWKKSNAKLLIFIRKISKYHTLNENQDTWKASYRSIISIVFLIALRNQSIHCLNWDWRWFEKWRIVFHHKTTHLMQCIYTLPKTHIVYAMLSYRHDFFHNTWVSSHDIPLW